jgi:hypothetical protein
MTPQVREDKRWEQESNDRQREWLNRKAKAEQEEAQRLAAERQSTDA